jgi:putative ABC transport system ATP-binding protein
MNNILLRLGNIIKEYQHKGGKVFALNNVSLSVNEGDFVVVTGASGSGKTTLLLIIGGLLHASSGTMEYDGIPISITGGNEMDHYRRSQVGFVMQNFALIPYLTASENVQLALHNKTLNNKGKTLRAEELLNWVGLGHRINHYPKELSAGQQQRVAIARALANKPSIILADEPTGNLDPNLSREILELLKKINAEQKTTIIMVTHSDLAAGYGNRHVRLENGRIVNTDGKSTSK